MGVQYVTLTLGSMSQTNLAEENLLNTPDYFSSVGGFWGKEACYDRGTTFGPKLLVTDRVP